MVRYRTEQHTHRDRQRGDAIAARLRALPLDVYLLQHDGYATQCQALSESSLQSHVHTRANTTAIATIAAHMYALAKLDVHVATIVSVH